MSLRVEISAEKAAELREEIRLAYAAFVHDQINYYDNPGIARLLQRCRFPHHEPIVVVITGLDFREFMLQIVNGCTRLLPEVRKLQQHLEGLFPEFQYEYRELIGKFEKIRNRHPDFRVGVTIALEYIQPKNLQTAEQPHTIATEAGP